MGDAGHKMLGKELELSGNGPEALEMKGLTRPNQMVNDDVIICRLTYMKKPFILFRNI